MLAVITVLIQTHAIRTDLGVPRELENLVWSVFQNSSRQLLRKTIPYKVEVAENYRKEMTERSNPRGGLYTTE